MGILVETAHFWCCSVHVNDIVDPAKQLHNNLEYGGEKMLWNVLVKNAREHLMLADTACKSCNIDL